MEKGNGVVGWLGRAGDVASLAALLGDHGIDERTRGLAQIWAVTGVPDGGGAGRA